jgi:hypothetical protein
MLFFPVALIRGVIGLLLGIPGAGPRLRPRFHFADQAAAGFGLPPGQGSARRPTGRAFT